MSEQLQTPEGSYYGNIQFEQVIFFHLLKLTNMSLRLFETATSTWQRNVINYYHGVKSLESIVFPYLGEKYEEESEEMRKESEKNYKDIKTVESSSLTKPTKYQEMNVTIEYSNSLLRLITVKLKEAGLLIPGSVGVIVEEQ